MKTLIFAMALLCAVPFSQANATCLKKVHKIRGVSYYELFRPVATADENGVASVRTPTGQMLKLGGLAPGQDVCKTYLFNTAWKKSAATGTAHLGELRTPDFCERGPQEGLTCIHVESGDGDD